MQRSFFGTHDQDPTNGWIATTVAARPRIFKTFHPEMIRDLRANGYNPPTCVFRQFIEGDHQQPYLDRAGLSDADADAAADDFILTFKDSVAAYAPDVYVESLNETYPTGNYETQRKAVAFDRAFIRRLKVHLPGCKPVVYNAPTGNIGHDEWEILIPLARECAAAGGAFGPHAYCSVYDHVAFTDDQHARDFYLRGIDVLYRNLVSVGIRVKMLIGEFAPIGSDPDGYNQKCNDGWKLPYVFNASLDRYVKLLAVVDAQFAGSAAAVAGDFLGAVLFTSGAPNSWPYFELDSYCRGKLLDYVAAVDVPDPEPEPVPVPTTKPAYILDVSRWQGVIDWPLAFEYERDLIAAAYPDEPDPRPMVAIRATVGDYYLDPMFEINWQQAKAAGFLCTVYHVVKPGIDYEAQMSLFGEAVRGKLLDDRPVLDVELTDDQEPMAVAACVLECKDWINEWFTYTESDLGVKPYIYTGAWFWNDANLWPTDCCYDCPLWAADYTIGATAPRVPDGFNSWGRWQFTSKGVIPGIPDNTCDLSYYWSDYATFRAALRPCRFDYEPEPEPRPDPEPVDPLEPSPVQPEPGTPVDVVPTVYIDVVVPPLRDEVRFELRVRYVD